MPDGTKVSPTLADVLAILEADADLATMRRRDLCSAVRRIAGLLGRDPARIPASVPEIRRALADVNPARAGISPKTFQNHQSNLLAALRHVGTTRHPSLARVPLNPQWEALHERLPDKRFRNGLSRFLHFCSAKGIEPGQVDDTVVDRFMDYVRESTLARKPSDVHRRSCRLWNEAAGCVPGWPQIQLSVPDNRPPRRRLSLEALPEDFKRDLEAYLSIRADPDPFDETVPVKPLKAGTLRLRREQPRLAASALVQLGREPGSITGLSDLVKPEAFKDILRQMRADHDNQPSAWVEGVAKTLVAVAKEWVHAPDDRLAELKRLFGRLPKVQLGLTRKNREALRQFDDEVNLARLLALPELLFQEACGINPPTHKAAVKAQLALAIELLLNCPIRGQNLISLRLDRHILRPAGRRGKVYLCLEPSEVKNEQWIDFEFPTHLTRMLETYLERFHPLLGGERCPYLFATRDGKQKSQATLAQQISATIYKRTGLRMSLHQFRHLGANLHLEGNPGGFESLRQLLGHKSTKTTVNAYAGLNTRRAARLHDEILARRRQALAGKVRFRDRRGRKVGR